MRGVRTLAVISLTDLKPVALDQLGHHSIFYLFLFSFYSLRFNQLLTLWSLAL